MNTEQFAAKNMVKATSVRVRLCQTGSYFGIKPKKFANGRLDWPDESLEVEYVGKPRKCAEST